MPGFSALRDDSGCSAMPIASVMISGGTRMRPKRSQPLRSATKAIAAIAAHSAMPGAALRRLSGAQRRTMSTAMLLLGIEHGHQLTLVDRLAFAHLDFLDGAGLGRQHGNFHLHRFQDHDLALDLDLVAGLELDLPDIAGDFRLH